MFRFFFFLLFFLSLNAVSQTNLTINGTLIDQDKAPVSFAQILAHSVDDDRIAKGTYSDEAGDFELRLPEGSYYLLFRFSGLVADTITLSQQAGIINLGSISMLPIVELKSFEVVAQRSAMEYQLDKRVFNVDADLNNQGANAVEVLENIPSITVDAEGNVSLRGNQNVRILIDGKMSGFATNADALQQLRADNIDRIEVITNASSRYDAQGEGGIINIILKKNQTKGFNGSVALRAGYNPEYGTDIRLNYRKNKINLFGSYSFNNNIRPGSSQTYQRLQNADTSFTYFQDYTHRRNKLSNNGSVGLDYYINDKNTLSTSFNIRSGLGRNKYHRNYENMDSLDIVTSSNYRYEGQRELEDLLEANINYKRDFNNKSSWTTDFKWFLDQDIEKSDYDETSSTNLGNRIEYSQVNTKEHNYLAQTDYILPFAKSGKFETGARWQYRDMTNMFRFGEKQGETWNHPAIYNDTYNYKEQVYALYAMAGNTWNKFSIQGGLRAEYTAIATAQYSAQLNNSKDYIDFFPSAAISFKRTDKQTFQLSYSRRISRPGQWDLMPFTKFGDNRERRVGNAALNPEYTNSLEAGILQALKSGSILGSIYYRRTTDKIERISSLGADNIIYITPLNIASRDAIGGELNFTYSIVKWMRLNTGFNVYQELIQGNYNNQDFKRSNFTWTNRTSINFSFPKIFRAQLAFNYTAPSVRPQGKTLAIYHFDLAFSRELFNKNATIGLNVRDVFNTRRWRNIIDTPELYAMSSTLWRPRSITLVFTYRFNQQKKDVDKSDFNLLEERGGE